VSCWSMYFSDLVDECHQINTFNNILQSTTFFVIAEVRRQDTTGQCIHCRLKNLQCLEGINKFK
jgi:hypothetical protein